MDPEGRPPRATSVPAGARTHRLARLIGLVLAAFVLVEGLLLGLGLLVTRVLDDSSLPRQEIEFEQTIVTERTPLFDQVTRYGSPSGRPSGHRPDGGGVPPARLARARAPSAGVPRRRGGGGDRALPAGLPGREAAASAVPQLDIAPPTSSFPSGHTAAIIALTCGLALALARTRTGRRLVALTWFLAVLLPAVVLASRLYRGMHWPTDVAASVVFALVWMVLLRAILLPRDVPDRRTSGPPGSS